VLSWRAFTEAEPEMAAAGRALLYQVGVGLAYLATTRPDGHPRLHPFCPILRDDAMYGFIIPSPKQRDLQRNGWYSLHSFPCEDNEDAFSMSGIASAVAATTIRSAVSDQFVGERRQFNVPPPADDDVLFEFALDSCLLTRTTGHGDPAPDHHIWRHELG
jgi:hypothetical protein